VIVVDVATKTAASSERAMRARPRPLSMLLNSVSVMGGKAGTMGLGFLFWVLAARYFTPDQVGLAAAAVSAMMLCTQLAILGVGSGVITRYPSHADHPTNLLNTAFSMVTAAALLFAGAFLLLSSSVFRELSVLAGMPVFAVLFVLMTLLGTLGILLDQVSIALRRGNQVLVRGLVFGGVTVVLIAVIAAATAAQGSLAIVLPWVVAGAAACAVGSVQLHRSLAGYRYRPAVNRVMTGDLLRIGVPNWALTLTERAPGLLLPILVTELLSPAENAAWYAVWMMAWVIFIIPISMGLALFAEATHQPESLRAVVMHGIRYSLAIGLPAAGALALLAPYALSLLGDSYADAGVTPLRILVFAFIPLAFVQAYFSVCRARQKLGEAIATGVLSGVASVSAAAAAGVAFGLTGMAVAWVVAQVVTGIWALWRLQAIAGGMRREVDPAADEATEPALSMTLQRPAAT
jgi:O-antigen/teichoic acid export membrane protein